MRAPAAILILLATTATAPVNSAEAPAHDKDKEAPINGPASSKPAASRPDTWATPLSLKGVPNLHKVSDMLYRGAQPDREGLRGLEKLSVRTVINLRASHSDKKLVKGTRLGLVEIEFDPWKDPRPETLREFLRTVLDPARCPCFVHCKAGSDRTGTAVAVYRTAVQGWSKDEAVREMTEGGFGFHSKVYAKIFDYPGWIRKLDVAAIKASEAALPQGNPRSAAIREAASAEAKQ